MSTKTITGNVSDSQVIDLDCHLSPPNSESLIALHQTVGKFVDMGVTDNDGISHWYYGDLYPEKPVPVYENDSEDVMLPEQDRIDPRGLLHVEL